MAASRKSSFLALRGTQGLWLMEGPRNAHAVDRFPCGKGSRTRAMAFSKNGTLMAYCDGRRVVVVSLPDCEILLEIDRPRTAELVFSPRNSVLAMWESYLVSPEIPTGRPNLQFYDMKTGKLLKELTQKKQQGWNPQWSEDEEICARNVNNEIHFYQNNCFDMIINKLHLQKVAYYALSPKPSAPHYLAAYVPGAKGQPSFVRVYQYPNFGGPNSSLANKSFYKADKVDLIWNKKGTALLVLTVTDTSAESYYGEQGLHFINTNGETCLVPRSKNGPIYSVGWNPKSTNFCVVYGFMPAKATLFNLKAEPVFDYGTGPRNICYFNPQGNILCLAGFGNLQGNIELWDVQKQQLMSNPKVPDTTHFEWCPDGEHILTATTSPRLRVSNGYKLWHYTGPVFYEEKTPDGQELWEVMWQPALDGTFPPPRLSGNTAAVTAAVTPDAPSMTAEVVAGTYIPPHLRNKTGTAPSSRPKFREEYEPPSNMKPMEESMSKAALKNKKKREAKARKQQEQVPEPEPTKQPSAAVPETAVSTGDPDKDKQIRAVRKKLQQIEKIKEKQASGAKLELNQLEKLKTEENLLKELNALTL